MTMCTMMKSPKDQVFDWYINRERAKGKVYERSVGIKPAIKAIRSGASFFYLPDQDHGREASIFVPFFGHPKGDPGGPAQTGETDRRQGGAHSCLL